MKKEEIKYSINSEVVKNYVKALNTINEPMIKIKEQMQHISEPIKEINEKMTGIVDNTNSIFRECIKSINTMEEELKKYSYVVFGEQTNVMTDVIKQIMKENNGVITSRLIEPLNISRQYLSIMENNKEIEKVSRGIYISPKTFDDSYYSFQCKYKKTVFSHMNALYFYDMTEEFPYNYTVTVPNSYHDDKVNEKCNVFYVNDDIYEIGICDVETPNGNKVKAYDLERCICDIIRSKNRMDIEQVKKVIKKYVKRSDKNINKLTEYSKKMGISKGVMEMVGMFIEN